MGGKILHTTEALVKNFSLDLNKSEAESTDNQESANEERLREAYNQGVEEGKKQILQQLSGQLSSLNEMIKQLSTQKIEIIKQTELDLVELAFKIAEKVININLERDKKLVLQILKKAISEVKDKSHIIVYISPEDEPIILENKDKLLEGIEGEVKFITDSQISKGGCIVQTASGRIDALITSQLDEIRKRMGIGK